MFITIIIIISLLSDIISLTCSVLSFNALYEWNVAKKNSCVRLNVIG